MRLHFFSGPELQDRRDFRVSYILANLKTSQTISLIYFVLSICIRIILEVFNAQVLKVTHMSEYDQANWISLTICPVFYIGCVQIIRFYEEDKKYVRLAQVFVFIFSLFVILNCMRATFFIVHNPRNTLVMYMVGLVVTGVFFTFEFVETVLLTIITGACFAITALFYLNDTAELFLNNLASFVLLAIFFSISRLSYSYRADNYLKLKAIEEKNTEIELAGQLKNEILGIVAHDLRNPLAAIKTLASIIENSGNVDDENQENLSMIKASCDKANNIINDLLETAHNDMGGEFELEKAELNKFLLLIVDEWSKNKKDNLNILFYGSKQPVNAMINPEKLQRVLDNLISNAVKFSGVSDHIEVLLKEQDGKVYIYVKDFGMGIPEDLMPYIFDRFSKASRRGVRGEESVGLGLSIVRQIIKKHDGEIEVSSTEKIGTTFTVILMAVA